MGSGQMNVLLTAFLKQHSLTASHKAVSFVATPASLLEISNAHRRMCNFRPNSLTLSEMNLSIHRLGLKKSVLPFHAEGQLLMVLYFNQ